MLELNAITKRFPGVTALEDVSFAVGTGEIHAVVGENGAGKSTLIKILGGLYRPDAGRVLYRSRPLSLHSTLDSQRQGISVVYQEFNLMPDLSVAENILAGREPRRGPFLNRQALNRQATHWLEQLGVEIDPRTEVEGLSVAGKQMVEIAKALSLDAGLIIMDEPTAAISDHETGILLETLRQLQAQGKSVLFVSHRLKEVFAVADRVTVLRDGRYVTTLDTAGTTEPELVRLMVGRDLGTPVARTSQAGQEPVLEVRGLTLEGVLDSISFGLCRGEILGVAGLMGAGRTELAEVLYGLVAPDAGHMVLDGVAYRPDGPRAAIAAGMGFLTEDRKAAGIFPDLSVAHNLSMALIPELTRAWGTMLDRQAERACVNRFRESMDIRCTSDAQTVRFLSGGNQQKVLLARALATQCRLLVLCEPTRGVDVGAKSEIHRLIRALADQGVAVVLVSSDLPEIIALSDRALVMHEGRVTADLEREQLTEERIMAHATGQESRV